MKIKERKALTSHRLRRRAPPLPFHGRGVFFLNPRKQFCDGAGSTPLPLAGEEGPARRSRVGGEGQRTPMRSAFFAAIAMTLAACTAPAETPTAEIPCADELMSAAQYTEQLAEIRVERMKVMRFASEAAMNAYIAETNRYESEAGRFRTKLLELETETGKKAPYTEYDFEDLSEDTAALEINSADSCIANLTK